MAAEIVHGVLVAAIPRLGEMVNKWHKGTGKRAETTLYGFSHAKTASPKHRPYPGGICTRARSVFTTSISHLCPSRWQHGTYFPYTRSFKIQFNLYNLKYNSSLWNFCLFSVFSLSASSCGVIRENLSFCEETNGPN